MSPKRPPSIMGDADRALIGKRQTSPGGVPVIATDTREARLAAPRRTPEEDRAELAPLDGAPERPALPDEVLVTGDFVCVAMMRARVVFPLPGGPQKIIDGT